jgi:FHA domain-containing protein
MDIAGKARKLERKITRTVDAAVAEFMGGTSEPAPLEVVHAVLDRAEQHIQEIGRGRRVFPFNRVVLHVVAPPAQKEKRARFSAVADGPPSLCERLMERLRSSGCAVTDLSADVVYARQRGADWEPGDFHVEFDRVARAPEARPAAPEPPASEVKRIRLSVVKGAAEQRAYVFSGGRIDIGRRSEVLDKRQHLVRTNHLAFSEDGAEVNGSVSRRHAHIDLSTDGQSYRLWDDKSAHGTSIIRNGRTIKVPAGARGTRLEPGDEIALGHARLRVTFESKK